MRLDGIPALDLWDLIVAILHGNTHQSNQERGDPCTNPALDLWDLIVSVLGNMTQTTERPGRPVIIDRSQRSQGKTNALNNIDCVPSNVQSSHQEALLYVFEVNEAVIKMIIKGKKPHNETCFQNPQSCA